jgi:DNA-binding SARP family transcriptional activator/tetratricopeptide (TPR) repeat protein
VTPISTFAPVRVGVLGPVTLTAGADVVALGGPKQRLVLGLLVAHAGHIVPIDDITDALWPEGPQARPRKTVQVYVTRLRGLFGEHPAAIQGVAAGYRFDPTVVELDAAEFESRVAEALHEADDEAAVAGLRQALGLWRGDAFADLRDCSALVPSAVRLDGLRISAMHDLFERETRLRPHSVIAELEHAVEAHPLDEGFAAQLMSAQYRAGRQADALATYQQLRRRLASELGLEPGHAVRELEGQILRHELAVAPAPRPIAPERQRRRVTIVSASIELAVADDVGDPEHEFAVLAPLRQVARSRVFGHGGMVTSEAADGLTACFGYPTRGDAAVQAVSAALALRDLSDPTAGVTVRVGVENGIVVIEASGDSNDVVTGVSGITGPPVRVASRLRDTAQPGEARLGPALAELVDREFELTPADITAGDGAAIAIRRRAVAAERRSSELGIVDRYPAIESLQAVAERAVHGLRPVVVTGPPGVGKSAVVEAFVDGLGADWATVSLHAGANHELAPLHAFRTGLPEAFESGDEPTVRQLATALRQRWDGRRPALVVENIHLIDPSSLTVLDQLADHVAEGLLAMTSREPRPMELAGEPVPTIALGPLETSDARTLARRCAGTHRLDLSTLNEIIERSGGTPLHVVELTRTMVGEEAPDRLPATLYDSLMWRLDRLGPGRAVVQHCAVLGGSFTVDDLVELTDAGSTSDVTQHLAAMVDRGVLREADGRYRFASALLADAAYESMLQTERRALHARIADAITASARRQPLERLAFHLESSGRLAEAAVAWRRAASVAIRQHANREAMHHARRAIRLVDELPPSDDPLVHETLVKALILLAIGVQATNHGSQELADVITRARAKGGTPSGTSLVLDLMDISNRQALGDLLGATEVAEATVRRADEDGNEMSAAFARQFLGATLVWRGELDAGSAALEQAAAFWDGITEPGPLNARAVGGLWALLALVHTLRGNDAEAERCVARARSVIAEDDGDGRCLVAATSAVIDQLCDRPATVREHLEPVWALATDIGSEFWLGWAQTLLGWAIAADDGPAGRAMMVEALESHSTVQGLPYFGYLLGARLGEAGELDEAIARLTAAIDLARTTGELLWQPLLLLERARWRDAAGDVEAPADAAEAAERAKRMGASRLVARCEAWLPGLPGSPTVATP